MKKTEKYSSPIFVLLMKWLVFVGDQMIYM